MHKKLVWFLLIGCSGSDADPKHPSGGDTDQASGGDSAQPSGGDTGQPSGDIWEPWNERISISLSGTAVLYIERTQVSENACVAVYDRGAAFMGGFELLAHTEVGPDGSWETEATEFKTQIGPLIVVEPCDFDAGGDFSPSSVQVPAETLRQAEEGRLEGLLLEVVSNQYVEDIRASFQAVERDSFYPAEEGIFGRILDPSDSPAQEAAVFCIDGFCPAFYHAEGADNNDLFRGESGEVLEKTSTAGHYLMPGAMNNTYGVVSEDWNYDNLTSGSLYGMWHLQDYYPSTD